MKCSRGDVPSTFWDYTQYGRERFVSKLRRKQSILGLQMFSMTMTSPPVQLKRTKRVG
jgi:hypothetical protein